MSKKKINHHEEPNPHNLKTENMEKNAFGEGTDEIFEPPFNEDIPTEPDEIKKALGKLQNRIEGLEEVIRLKDLQIIRAKIQFNETALNLHSERLDHLRAEQNNLK